MKAYLVAKNFMHMNRRAEVRHLPHDDLPRLHAALLRGYRARRDEARRHNWEKPSWQFTAEAEHPEHPDP